MQKDSPLTQKEFHEEMDANMQLVNEAFEQVVTKKGLKEELKRALEPYVTKEYLKEALKPYATKEDIKAMLDENFERLDKSIFKTLQNHEHRIKVIEHQL